jgi:hypothetical protein
MWDRQWKLLINSTDRIRSCAQGIGALAPQIADPAAGASAAFARLGYEATRTIA